jgi:hypothetical protein
MRTFKNTCTRAHGAWFVSVLIALGGCVTEVAPPRVRVYEPPPPIYVPAPPSDVISVYVEPPLEQPPPIAVGWAPPAMLVELPPPPPFEAAVWVGGYWVWQGTWVWAHGHWAAPPRPDYGWVHPYYENRDGVVIFISGHWSPPGVRFVPPPPGLRLTVEIGAVGMARGPRPIGPNGVFVPAPPGSRAGIIVPAPIGTAPAVVTGAPPVIAPGMRVNATVNNTTVRNNTVINNVTNVSNVTIVAPASATVSHQAVNTAVPAQAHLAAAQPSVIKAQAPAPSSNKPLPTYRPGSGPVDLPPSRAVNSVAPASRETERNAATPPPAKVEAAERMTPGAPAQPVAAPRPPVTPAPKPVEAQNAHRPEGRGDGGTAPSDIRKADTNTSTKPKNAAAKQPAANVAHQPAASPAKKETRPARKEKPKSKEDEKQHKEDPNR